MTNIWLGFSFMCSITLPTILVLKKEFCIFSLTDYILSATLGATFSQALQ